VSVSFVSLRVIISASTGRSLPVAPVTHSSAARPRQPASAAALGEASHQSNPVPTLRRRVLTKHATAMVRGLKILLTFGYAENAFNPTMAGSIPGRRAIAITTKRRPVDIYMEFQRGGFDSRPRKWRLP
jgi:hypothetical protein